LPRPRGLTRFGFEFVDRFDRDLHLLMTEHHRAEHHVFGQAIGFGFHHEHRFRRAGDDQVELRCRELGARGIQNVLTVFVADLHRADGAHERHAGQGKRRRRADHRRDIGIYFGIERNNRSDDLNLV
jgi:hypothetical protein